MIQRIQSVYLLLIAVLMAALAVITSNILLSILFAILGIASLIAVFLYKKRKKQILITSILLLILIFVFGSVCFLFWRESRFIPDMATAMIGLLSPVSAILAFLAIKAIKKDEKLVRSLDRLR